MQGVWGDERGFVLIQLQFFLAAKQFREAVGHHPMFASLPVKMLARWLFNLKYVVAIPEFFFNI